MTAPKSKIVQAEYQNPHASSGLKLSMMIVSNTPEEQLESNIKENSVRHKDWLKFEDEHKGRAVLIGGGASVEGYVQDIIELQRSGATVFAMNAASKWAREKGIQVDYQVMLDAKEESAQLVDHYATKHLFASQCHSETLKDVDNLTLWHLDIGNTEDLLPEDRVKQGGYTIIGGGASVGNSATCVVYTLGFRNLHLFGYDSSHKDGRSHVYEQAMNDDIPITKVMWGGKEYIVSIAMKAQAEKFQLTARALKDVGCSLHIYGNGLLQAMYRTKVDDLSEQEKYQLIWQFDDYRENSPGENQSKFYLNRFNPEGLIIDYGCGTGRAGLNFNETGRDVLLIDFADNCRDEEAIYLPFLQWDLTKPIPQKSEHGYCTDVMEHIPPEDVQKVIDNIMESSEKVFFQISTTEEYFGGLINTKLHLTVKPHEWWKSLFEKYRIEWEMEQEYASLFYIHNPDRRKV